MRCNLCRAARFQKSLLSVMKSASPFGHWQDALSRSTRNRKKLVKLLKDQQIEYNRSFEYSQSNQSKVTTEYMKQRLVVKR